MDESNSGNASGDRLFRVRARAPLRLGLGGGGTDVSPFCDDYGGAVLNATIGMYAYATLEPRSDGLLAFETCDRGERVVINAAEAARPDEGFALHYGVYNRIVQQFRGGEPFPCTLRTHCDAPPGSGLGSSSTLVVAMLVAFQEMLGIPLGEYELARLAYEIERKDLGMSGGKQDQYAAAFGGVNFMEFLAGDRVIVNPLRIKRRVIAELEASLVLYFTGVSRASAQIIEEQSDNMRDPDGDAIAAALELKADAVEIKEAALLGDIRRFGEVLNRSWLAKKRMAAKISNSEIDRIYDLAMTKGAFAGKVSGAGGGGFMMFVCEPANRPDLIRSLANERGQVFVTQFTEVGAEAWRPGH